MSKVTSSQSYVFHTDIGVVVNTVETVEDFDIEDIVKAGAFSEAAKLMFTQAAADRDINAPVGSRTIKTAYSGE